MITTEDYFGDIKDDVKVNISKNGIEATTTFSKYKLPCWILPEERDTFFGYMLAIAMVEGFAVDYNPLSFFQRIIETKTEDCLLVFLQHKYHFLPGSCDLLRRNIKRKNLSSGLIQLKKNIICHSKTTSIGRKTVFFSREFNLEHMPLFTSDDVFILANRATKKPIGHSDYTKSMLPTTNMRAEPIQFDKTLPHSKIKAVTIDQTNMDENGHVTAAFYISLIAHAMCSGENRCQLKELLLQYIAETFEGDVIDVLLWKEGGAKKCMLSRGNQPIVKARGLFYNTSRDMSKL